MGNETALSMPLRTGAREGRVSQELVNEKAVQASDKPYAGALPRSVASNSDAVHPHRCDGPRIRSGVLDGVLTEHRQ